MRLLLAFCLFVFFAPYAQAQMLVDSPAGLRLALERTPEGGDVFLAPGRYDVADLKIGKTVTLKGRGDVILFSSKPVAKGLLNPLPGVSLTVENIVFTGAQSPDKNGAGIRHDGANLTIINSIFRDNENGILSTSAEDGVINISDLNFRQQRTWRRVFAWHLCRSRSRANNRTKPLHRNANRPSHQIISSTNDNFRDSI